MTRRDAHVSRIQKIQRPVARSLLQRTVETQDERHKMVRGERFNVNDSKILQDKESCRRALKGFNDRAWTDPTSNSKGYTRIQQPFSCDFLYNIISDANVSIGSNCQMRNYGLIKIGNSVRIGQNVTFDCVVPQSVIIGLAGITIVARGINIGNHVVIQDDAIIPAGARIPNNCQVLAPFHIVVSVSLRQKHNTKLTKFPVSRAIEPSPKADVFFCGNAACDVVHNATQGYQKLLILAEVAALLLS